MTSNSKNLGGKGAVITGAGRGIGQSIAIGYARAGASVCCAARTKTEIEWTVAPLVLFLATQPDLGLTAQSYSLMRRDS